MPDLLSEAWRLEFLWRLKRETGWAPSRRAHRRLARDLADRFALPGEDAQARFNRTLATGLHATVEVLERERGLRRDEAAAAAGAAFLATGRWTSRLAVKFWLAMEADPMRTLTPARLSRTVRRLWGEGMEAKVVAEPGRTTLLVTRCPFEAYFSNASRSDLTGILCAWDSAWMADVNASRRPIAVTRSGALAQGRPHCDFVFHAAPEEAHEEERP